MKTIIAAAAVALVLGTAGQARAQEWFWGATYSTVMPLGNTKDFNSSFSWRGATIEGRKMIKENLSAGLSFGWHVLADQYDNRTVEYPIGAITGTFFNYTNSFPILANVHYYLGQPGGVRPFIGANVGTAIMERRSEVGLFALTEDNWTFAAAPEAGLAFPVGWHVAGLISARWHFMTAAGSAPSQQYVTFNVGFASK